MSIRALTLLNNTGDQTIAWTEDRDAEMTEIIRKKMDQGVTFFIITPRMGGFMAPDKTPLKRPGDAKKHRILSIADEDFAKFVGLDGVDVVKTPPAPVVTVKKSKDPAEVAKSESVGVRPLAGG